MYSGYITVDHSAGRALFYWLVEAQESPETKPLIFWYQGGPGCSGLGGLMTENGPFQPNEQGGITYTDLSWTKFANVVYLEQPAFVGFSYSNTSSDRNTGDDRAAKDNYAFVQGFIEAFPDYKGRDTWFTGESYGGNYVPSLTAEVLSNSSTQIYKQFQGFMIGNPVFFCGTMGDNTISLDMLYWHGLVSYGNFFNYQKLGCRENENAPGCSELFNKIQNEVGVIDQELKKRLSIPKQPSLDPDCLYQDFCTGNGTLEYPATIPIGCQSVGSRAAAYLNRADVQQAIHAKGPNGGAPAKWTECTGAINYDITGRSMVPLYQNFHNQKPGVKILVYSGDVDILTVPFGYTQPCLHQIGARETKTWAPWFVNGQSVGYWEQFDLYTYATVRGAGHEAPQYQPLSSYHMIQRFINSQSLKDPSGNEPIPVESTLTQGQQLREMLARKK